MRGNLEENSCGKILWEILAGKSCLKFLCENFVGNAVGNLVGNLPGKSSKKSFNGVTGLKMAKNYQHRQFLALLGNFKPITTIKTLSNYFYLVEEVLIFDLVGHM